MSAPTAGPPLVLTLGEVGGPPPENVVHAVVAAILSDRVRYTPPAGLDAVREAVAATACARALDPAEVVITTGASGAFLAAMMRLGHPGARVLLPDPGYPAYPGLCRRLGLSPEFYPLRDDFSALDTDALAARLGPDVAALVVLSPGNPTGRSVDPESVLRAADLAARAGVPTVLDEAYTDLVGGSPFDPDALRARHPDAVVLRSFSKTYALSGFRVGAAIARPELTAELASAHFSAVMSAPTAGQLAVRACLCDTPAEYLESARVRLRERAAISAATLGALPGCAATPSDVGVFTWLRTPLAGDVLATRLAGRHAIAVQSGAPFGPSGADRVRILTDVAPGDVERVARAIESEVLGAG